MPTHTSLHSIVPIVLLPLALLSGPGCRTTTEAQPAMALESTAAVTADAAWIRLCTSLERSGREVLALTEGESKLDRLEGYRLLARLLALGFDRVLEHSTARPVDFFELQGPTRKFAGDNPDQRYHAASIDGRSRYRIRGWRGNALLLEIGVYGGDTSFSDGRTDGGGVRRLVAFLDENGIEFGEDGSFEVVVEPDPPPGRGLKLEPDASSLLVRSYHADPRDKRIELEIERLDASEPTGPLDEAELALGLLGTAAFLESSVRVWGGWIDAVATNAENRLVPLVDAGDLLTPGGIRYHQGYWRLGPNEAMIVEFEDVDVPYGGFIAMNRWMESLEWRDRRVSLNNHDALVDPDGRVRLILAHRDPGLPNWLDTAGHEHGLMSTRFARLEGELPEVVVRVLPFDELARALAATAREP